MGSGANFGGKREERKKKKGATSNVPTFSSRPVFSMPKMVEKKKKSE